MEKLLFVCPGMTQTVYESIGILVSMIYVAKRACDGFFKWKKVVSKLDD